MKRTFSNRPIAVTTAISLLLAARFNDARTRQRPALARHSAVIRCAHAALRALPSRFAASVGASLRGQTLALWAALISDYFHVCCNGTDGSIHCEHITVSDVETAQ